MSFLPTPDSATHFVLWGGFVLGLVFGALGQWSRFCVRGAIADWFADASKSRFVAWVVAVAVAALGTQILIGLNLFDATRTLAWNSRLAWASCIVGGLLFGYGMVLSGGCPQRSLVKAGTGDLRAIITLVVTAIAALMTLRGLFAPLRIDGLDRWSITLATPQDIGSIIAPDAAATVRWLAVAVILLIAAALAWRNRKSLVSSHWIGGIGVGVLVPMAWLLTGHIGFLAEHPETLEPAWLGTQGRRPEGLSFSAPLAHALDLLTLWTDKNTTASFGITVGIGVLLGSFVSSKIRGDFKLQSFQNSTVLRSHLAGGLLMGFGGVTALGCSIGQGLTGLAMLSAGAVLAVVSMVTGAVLALRFSAAKVATEQLNH